MNSRNIQEELALAIQVNDLQKVARIVQDNFDLTSQVHQGFSAIEYAWRNQKYDCIKLIVSLRPKFLIDIGQYDQALFFAVYKNNFSLAKTLLLAGADPSHYYLPPDENYTIHYAIINKNPMMLALLLIHASESTLQNKNKDNQTAKDLANSLMLNDIFNEGKDIYHKYSQMPLVALLQGHRQQNNILSTLPFEILHDIADRLHECYPPLSVIKKNMLNVSAKHFLTKCYSVPFIQPFYLNIVLNNFPKKLKKIQKIESAHERNEKIEMLIKNFPLPVNKRNWLKQGFFALQRKCNKKVMRQFHLLNEPREEKDKEEKTSKYLFSI